MKTYSRNRHQTIESILESVNQDMINEFNPLFCGGTQIALEHGEFRESVDIDFVIPNLADYASLRRLLTTESPLNILSNNYEYSDYSFRSDRYSIRFQVNHPDHTVKFELFSDPRIKAENPIPFKTKNPNINLLSLSGAEKIAAKLMAITDRGLDRTAMSKDIVDLCVLFSDTCEGDISEGLGFAYDQYRKDVILGNLSGAMSLLQKDDAYADKVTDALSISNEGIIMISNGWDVLGVHLHGDLDFEPVEKPSVLQGLHCELGMP